jgi:hypothetical protein
MLLVRAAVVVLRWRERVPHIPLTPILFCLSCLYMLWRALRTQEWARLSASPWSRPEHRTSSFGSKRRLGFLANLHRPRLSAIEFS